MRTLVVVCKCKSATCPGMIYEANKQTPTGMHKQTQTGQTHCGMLKQKFASSVVSSINLQFAFEQATNHTNREQMQYNICEMIKIQRKQQTLKDLQRQFGFEDQKA